MAKLINCLSKHTKQNNIQKQVTTMNTQFEHFIEYSVVSIYRTYYDDVNNELLIHIGVSRF